MLPFYLTFKKIKEMENAVLVSFVISNDQERLEIAQDWQGLRAGLTCFWSSLINVISKDVNMVFCLSCIIRRLKA